MPGLETYIEPNTKKQLLNNLNLAIDEAKLVLNITNLSDLLFKLETSGGDSRRIASIRNEIKIKELQLDIIRDKADLQMSAIS